MSMLESRAEPSPWHGGAGESEMAVDMEIRGLGKVWCRAGPMVNPWKLSEFSLMFLGAGMEPQADDGYVDPHPHRERDFPELGTSSALTPKSCLQDNYIPMELKLKPNGNLVSKVKISKSCSVGGERIGLGAQLLHGFLRREVGVKVGWKGMDLGALPGWSMLLEFSMVWAWASSWPCLVR